MAAVMGVRTVFVVSGAVVILAGLASLLLFGMARRRGPEPGALVESEAPA
jgi:hypothetical protein